MIKITGTRNNNLRIKVAVDGELFDGKLDLDHREVSFEGEFNESLLFYAMEEIARQLNEFYGYYNEEEAEWYTFRFYWYDDENCELNEYGCSGFKASGF